MRPKQIKLATLNLFNLQLPGKPMYRGRTYSQQAYQRKVEWTARIINQLDADLIGFQELWSGECLHDVFRESGLREQYDLITTDRYPGISVALAVRSSFKTVYRQWIKDFPKAVILKKRKGPDEEPDYEMSVSIDHFSRPLLRITVKPNVANDVDIPNLSVWVAHLKSKLATRLDDNEQRKIAIRRHSEALGSALSTIRRTAEAAAFRVLLNKIMRDTHVPVVVLGDLNDAQLSVTTSIITGHPKYRLFSKSRVGVRSDRGLYSAATLQEYRSLRDVYYTHIHQGRHESLDHILVSEQFYDYSDNRLWSFRGMKLFNDYLESDDVSNSDHAAVLATFDYNPS